MKKLFLLATITFVLLVLACTKTVDDTDSNDCSTATSFTGDVYPIIQSTCATNSGCHAAGSSEGPGAFTTYAQIYNHRSAIRTAVANGSMPKSGSLTASQKNAILCWIDNGASNN